MCRNIKTLFNFDPPTTNEEIQSASLQYVRKVSGFGHPSAINEKIFNETIKEISIVTKKLLKSLKTDAHPHDRTVEAAKAHARAIKRFHLD